MKRLSFLLLIISCLLMNSCNQTRFTYTNDMKSYFSTPDAYIHYPSDGSGDILTATAVLSDIIIEGTIIDEGIEHKTAFIGGPELISTRYQVKVTKKWYGDCDSKITVGFYGAKDDGVLKPHIGDKMILFLYKGVNAEAYGPVSYEDSMFVINPPDDKIFAFSNKSELSKLDGKTVKEFKNEVSSKLSAFAENSEYKYDIGKVGNSALKDNDPRKIPEELIAAEEKRLREAYLANQSSPD